MTNWVAWKTGVALAALFGLGVATGWVVGRWSAPLPSESPSAPPATVATTTNRPVRAENLTRRWGENRKANYLRAIRPTPQQAEAIERHFQTFTQEVGRIQANTRNELQQALRQMHRNIEAELTPAQRRAFMERLKKMEKTAEAASH